MVSLSRRQLLIGGIVGAVAPAIPFASPVAQKLVLSGRVVRDGSPVGGASFMIGGNRVVTDTDGRFVLITDTRAAFPANARRDDEGAWRATTALTI